MLTSQECTGPVLDVDFFRFVMGPQTRREVMQIGNRNVIFMSCTHEAAETEKRPDGRHLKIRCGDRKPAGD